MSISLNGEMTYKIELTEEQMRVTMIALEEYFRPRIGRTYSQDAVDGLMEAFRSKESGERKK